MNHKEFHQLLKKNKSNSGFTLTELLVGLLMGTIVIGGLGFGLVYLLRSTQTQTAFTGARNESARALDFISDEVKRAVAIEDISTNASNFTLGSKEVVFALDIPELNTDIDLGSDTDLTTTERVVYYLRTNTDTNWQGPQVLYRYGPPLKDDGSYGDGDWQEEALIDGITDQTIANSACVAGQVTTPTTPTGFYACIQDDDLDGNVEPEDTDKIGIAAQLYLTSGVDVGIKDNNNKAILDTYTANSQVVARARVAPADNSEAFNSYSASLFSLNPQYGLPNCWNVRSDFGIGKNPSFDPGENPPNADALQNINTWIHQDNRQPQPLNIDTTQPFTMVASGFALNTDTSRCIARGNRFKQQLVSIDNQGNNAVYSNVDANGNDVTAGNEVLVDGTEKIHTYEQKVWHTLEFPQEGDNNSVMSQKRATFNGNETENADVKGDGTVYVFRNDSVVPPNDGGYDVAGNNTYEPGDGDQPSLRDFLRDPNQDGNNNDAYVNPDGTFIEGKLKPEQRLVAFEIGQTEPGTNENPNPGFDLQDNLFIITSDAFSAYNED